MSCKIYVTVTDPTNGRDGPKDIEQQTLASPQMDARRNIADITFSPWLKTLGLDFPFLTDVLMKQYQQHNMENFNPFVFIPTILVMYTCIVVRNGFAGYYTYGGKCFHISLLFGCVFL